MVWQQSSFPLIVISAGGGFTGLFEYSPIPGAGNLVSSITPANGTDPYGNAYLAGQTVYGSSGGTQIALQETAGTLVFRSAPTQAGPWTQRANLIVDNSSNWTQTTQGNMALTAGSGLLHPSRLTLAGNSGLTLDTADWQIIVPSGGVDTAIINAALAKSPAVLMMPGTYLIDGPLLPPSDVVWRGFSGTGNPSANFGAGGLPMASTVIQATAGFAGAAMVSMVSSGSQTGGQRIEGIAFDGSVGPGGINAIQAIGAVAQVKLRDIAVYGGVGRLFGYGLLLNSNADGNPDAWDVDACAFQLCNSAGVGLLAGVADSFWRNVSCTACNADAWRIVNGNGSRYLFCKGETSVTGYGFNITGAPGYTGFSHFTNCSGGANFLGDFSVAGTGTGTVYFDFCHGNSAAVWTYAGTMNVKTPAAYNVSTAAPTFN